ncbi:hypothetical protein [Hyunsoonleella rubra]|uniref:Uncharacterized protein n=1 Tax=Hyunsoonleella rubra TaxID=1737062 RepID=A0ABW5TAI6_9FLAO
MTLEEFNTLTHDKRLFAVVDKGFFLDNYLTQQTRINLYSLDRFYVELVYGIDADKIIKVRSFKSGIDLDKYIDNVKLDKI